MLSANDNSVFFNPIFKPLLFSCLIAKNTKEMSYYRNYKCLLIKNDIGFWSKICFNIEDIIHLTPFYKEHLSEIDTKFYELFCYPP